MKVVLAESVQHQNHGGNPAFGMSKPQESKQAKPGAF